MKIIDAHCDLLDKMMTHPELEFKQDSYLADVSFPRLHRAGIAVQFFAVFVSDRKKVNFDLLLEGFDLFHQKIASHPEVRMIRTRGDLQRSVSEGKLGALLTLEGADGLEGSMMYLRTAYNLGLRLLGLTWNHANWAADGVMEPRKGGLTQKGKQLVGECAKLGIILDVSHLAERGFWELTEISTKPFVATHSNTLAICPHPRNLTDEQIKALIIRGGIMGLTFVPWFVKSSEATIKDILTHLDHVCSLGGASCVGFGSDFDGVGYHIPGLEHPGLYEKLGNEIYKKYPASVADNFLFGNWYRFLCDNLPV